MRKMKLQIQTLTGQTAEVEAEPQDTILDLKVCISKERDVRISHKIIKLIAVNNNCKLI